MIIQRLPTPVPHGIRPCMPSQADIANNMRICAIPGHHYSESDRKHTADILAMRALALEPQTNPHRVSDAQRHPRSQFAAHKEGERK
ncbi:hypothetical protein BASA_1288 [Bifidobacterium animalis subsp. animalis]|nr:hypothetical protein BASA_1288 [Bifidobacterium animalis subsp. animalis]